MRTLGEIAHPGCKISLFSWNQKFIVKFEQGLVEQTLKFDHLDISEAELRARLNDAFIAKILINFQNLQDLRGAVLNE